MHEFCPLSGKGTIKGRLSYKQLERIFESSPDSILVYDKDEKIIRTNAKAIQLFEVTSSDSWKGKSSQQFLQDYQPSDLWQRSTCAELWLMNLIRDKEAGCDSPEQTLMLHMPSGRRVYVDHWRVPLFDERQHKVGSFSVFHNITYRYQKALHLQRVREAINALTDTIAHLPAHIDPAFSQDMPLVSAPVIFVAQSLVDVTRQVLECRRVSLVAFGPSGHDYLVAGSGLTPEQEQYWQCMKGQVLCLKELIDETVLARLSARQEVIVPNKNIHLPLPFHATDGPENILMVPLFLEQRWVGVMAIVKAEAASSYTQEEVELVKAVAAQTLLIIQCLVHLNHEAEGQTRALVQHEIDRLSEDFLTLASHELLTPLTAILGNIQLAQRRLETLKRNAVNQPEQVHESIERAQRPLASASESASLQRRMINDLVDDAQIQTHRLTLHMDHHDLLTLLEEAVSKQRQSVPESTIVLNILPAGQRVPIFADAERITRVLNTYLVNALTHSPGDAPVTVQLVVADSQALISVHDEGAGITRDEQERLWERFYRAKGSAVQHELDLSLGLGFYLCRELIELHHGRVGVQSEPGKGETFWLTLPVVASSEE
jgi:signal transduction histidine kinase